MSRVVLRRALHILVDLIFKKSGNAKFLLTSVGLSVACWRLQADSCRPAVSSAFFQKLEVSRWVLGVSHFAHVLVVWGQVAIAAGNCNTFASMGQIQVEAFFIYQGIEAEPFRTSHSGITKRTRGAGLL